MVKFSLTSDRHRISVLTTCTVQMLLVASIGCEQSEPKDIGPRAPWVPEYAKWSALDDLAFNNDPAIPTLEQLAKIRRREARGVVQPELCALIENQKFQESVKNFAETAIPAK